MATVEYAEFEVEYKRVLELIMTGRRDQIQPADVEKLRARAAKIDDEDDREDAYLEVSVIESAAAAGPSEPPTQIIVQARAAYSEAVRDDGTVAERLARAEEGMRALERLSPGADPDEKAAIGDYEHVIHRQIGALRLMQ